MESNQAIVMDADVELGQLAQAQMSSTKEIVKLGGRQHEYKRSISLYIAALEGDLETARLFQKEEPNWFVKRISRLGDNALHIASVAKQSDFVKQALRTVTADQLEYKNKTGNTAYHLAAASGALEIVLEMEHRNPGLPNLSGSHNYRPIHMAAMLGHRDVVLHLLQLTFDKLSVNERIMLIITTIDTELYDVTLKILDMDASLAIARNENGDTPLHVLARKPRKKGRGLLQNTWMCFSSLSREENARVQLITRLWDHVMKQSETTIYDVLTSPQPKLLFTAIEMGNFEFAIILIQSYPDLLFEVDEEYRTLLHAAVKFRQEKIFAYISRMGGLGHLLAAQTERDTENNILHLAATLPPIDRLHLLPACPALQFQRELFWFQAVKDMVSPETVNSKNKKGDTPQALFIKEHQELRNKAEQWMRKTAISGLVLATVFATIAFQATFQLSKSDNNRIPKSWSLSSSSSLARLLFAVALFTSTSSMLTFASVLGSAFVQEDFLMSLPLKLMAGIVFLFCSSGTVLTASTTIVLQEVGDKIGWIVIHILAGITCIFYVQQYIPLLVNLFCSTFRYPYLFSSRS